MSCVLHFQVLIVLITVIHHSDATCRKSGDPPLVSVMSPSHLNVNWSNAFTGCQSKLIHVAKTEVYIQENAETKRNITVELSSKFAEIETNICVAHVIEIKVIFTNLKTEKDELQDSERQLEEVWSSIAYYNFYHAFPDKLYAGLLQEEVIKNICDNGQLEFVIPFLPNEIVHCVTKPPSVEIGSKTLKLEIINPSGPGTIPLQFHFEADNCTSKLETAQSAEQERYPEPDVIIGTSLSAGIFLVLVSIVVICQKCRKKTDEAQADENPMYEGAADYEYDNVDNSSEVTDTIMGRETTDTTMRREVRAEVVDRNSIYGEELEGWEGALTSDNNPDYD